MALPLIIDCDPGVDDAVALLLAFAAPELDILGITTVAGNVPVSRTTANARRICQAAGREETGVHAGCGRPLLFPERTGATAHGADGLGGVDLPEPRTPLHGQHAVAFLIDRIRAQPGQITLATLGPMTNLAVALAMAPDIAAKFRRLVFMGGAAFCPGNITARAEFNLWFDPHAAQAVLASGIPTVMLGLDVTSQAVITPARLAGLHAAGVTGDLAARMLTAYASGDPLLHDPCVIAWLLEPGLFSGIDAVCEVETGSPLSLGQTVASATDRQRAGRAPNCHVVTGVDADGLFALLERRLASRA